MGLGVGTGLPNLSAQVGRDAGLPNGGFFFSVFFRQSADNADLILGCPTGPPNPCGGRAGWA